MKNKNLVFKFDTLIIEEFGRLLNLLLLQSLFNTGAMRDSIKL